MKKILIIIFISIIIIAGCSSTPDTNTENNNNPVIDKLCENEYDLNYELYRCENVYTLIPSPDLLDAPAILFNEQGEQIGYCGGIPAETEDEKQPAECSNLCETINLCK